MEFREHVEDFNDQPWCKAILESPEYQLIEEGDISRLLPPSKQNGTNTNAFWAKTLASPDTIRACLAFYRPAASLFEAEILMIMSIGSATDGHSGILHGGMISTILDEVQGLACSRTLTKGTMTAKMEVRYKKPIPTPCLLLGRARLVRQDGKKLWSFGTLEDGKGTVYTESDSLFIQVASRL